MSAYGSKHPTKGLARRSRTVRDALKRARSALGLPEDPDTLDYPQNWDEDMLPQTDEEDAEERKRRP